jgi:hypothetical protein
VESLLALGGGFRFRRAFRAAATLTSSQEPSLTLFLPLRGIDPGLEENLRSFFRQTYGDHQIVLVTDRREDPSFAVAGRIRKEFPDTPSRLLVAGPAEGRGQKVHNLLFALDHVRDEDLVLAFGDSDIRPSPSWLGSLVRPLANPAVGVSTGFRWHVPQRGGFASVLRSVWNAGITSLMAGRRPPFAWGGALALRREVFERTGVRERWQGSLSDDYAVTRAVEESGLSIRFEPRSLSFSHEDCSLRQLLDWSFRQLAITRVYRPELWRAGLVGETFANLTLWGGLVVVGVAIGRWLTAESGPSSLAQPLLLGGLLVAAYVVRGVKAGIRLRAVVERFPEETAGLRRWRLAFVLGTPIASLVTLTGLLRSAVTREIRWRGIRYRMVSPTRTEILSHDPPAARREAG